MAHGAGHDDACTVKERRHNARTHDVRRLGCSPSSEESAPVVRGGHAALDRALARAAVRNAAQPPMSALRAACRTTAGLPLPVAREGAAPGARLIDGVCITPARDDAHARVVHVSTVREVPSRDRWYRIRVWRELSALSAN